MAKCMYKILKNIDYSIDGRIKHTMQVGEQFPHDCIISKVGNANIIFFLENKFLEKIKENAENQIQEIMYKTEEKLQDSTGKTIRKGTQLTEQELQSKGLDKDTLLQQEKLIEIKIVK